MVKNGGTRDFLCLSFLISFKGENSMQRNDTTLLAARTWSFKHVLCVVHAQSVQMFLLIQYANLKTQTENMK